MRGPGRYELHTVVPPGFVATSANDDQGGEIEAQLRAPGDLVPRPPPAPVGLAPAPVGQLSVPSKIKLSGGGDKHTYTRFKRNAHVAGSGACRVRSFHGRLSDDGLAFMDDKINEWLDNHPEIEVKLVNCVVGPLEGKVTGEQALFVTVWY